MTVKISVLLHFCLLLPFVTLAQLDTEANRLFFDQQIPEFERWLEVNHLSAIMNPVQYELTDARINLIIQEAEGLDCATFQGQYQAIKDSFGVDGNMLLHQKLLDIWSVLTDAPLDSVGIIIRCSQPSPFSVSIYGEESGRIVLEENNLMTMGAGHIEIRADSIRSMYRGRIFSCGHQENSVSKIRNAISHYLNEIWYKDKGSFLHKVHIDSMSSFHSEFIFHYTRLTNEALVDEGYFEYHRIHVKVVDVGGRIRVNWSFTGKFGGGIIYPPKRNDYSLMENYYKEYEEEYEQALFRNIKEYIQNN